MRWIRRLTCLSPMVLCLCLLVCALSSVPDSHHRTIRQRRQPGHFAIGSLPTIGRLLREYRSGLPRQSLPRLAGGAFPGRLVGDLLLVLRPTVFPWLHPLGHRPGHSGEEGRGGIQVRHPGWGGRAVHHDVRLRQRCGQRWRSALWDGQSRDHQGPEVPLPLRQA